MSPEYLEVGDTVADSPVGQAVAAPVTEADMLKVIDERDSYHEVADDLASQIAAITGQELGEHSSGNDPWRNAMLAADEFIAQQLRDMVVAASRSPAAVVAAFGDEMVEAAASALVDSCIAKGHWRHATEESKAVYREHASAVLASAASQRVPVASPAEPMGFIVRHADRSESDTSTSGGGGADWGLDISTGTPILVYKKCSVIESEQARYVLRLIAAGAGGAGVMDA